jgi:hypothetical protein
LLDLLSVEVDHTSESEIDWGLERVGQAFGSNWEGNSVVESNVLVHTLAESLVADLSHRVDKFLAISFTRWDVQFLFQDIDIGSLLSVSDSLHKDCS